MKRIVYIVSFMMFMLGISSCVHKELCYNHAHTVDVNVVFDWRDAPEASPASMSLYLFPVDGSEALRYDFTGRDGGTIRVPIGHYNAICLNSDTENVFYRNNKDINTFEIYTRPVSLLAGLSSLLGKANNVPMAEGTENETVASELEPLWTGRSMKVLDFDLTEKSKTIVFYPQPATCFYDVEIRNAKNLKYISGVSCALSSLAGGMIPYKEKVTDELITIPFDAVVHLEESTITGDLLSFGYSPDAAKKHQLTVYAVLADDSKWYYTYDVTDQIHNARDPRFVHIVIDGLPLPKPIVNGGGFQPSVNDWTSVDVDINM